MIEVAFYLKHNGDVHWKLMKELYAESLVDAKKEFTEFVFNLFAEKNSEASQVAFDEIKDLYNDGQYFSEYSYDNYLLFAAIKLGKIFVPIYDIKPCGCYRCGTECEDDLAVQKIIGNDSINIGDLLSAKNDDEMNKMLDLAQFGQSINYVLFCKRCGSEISLIESNSLSLKKIVEHFII